MELSDVDSSLGVRLYLGFYFGCLLIDWELSGRETENTQSRRDGNPNPGAKLQPRKVSPRIPDDVR